jgi:hypothetical protein
MTNNVRRGDNLSRQSKEMRWKPYIDKKTWEAAEELVLAKIWVEGKSSLLKEVSDDLTRDFYRED